MTDDPDLEAALAKALGTDPPRQPPPERVAAVRAYAAQARAHRTPPAEVEPPVGTPPPAPPGDATVVPLRARPARRGRRDVLIGAAAASIGAALGVGGIVATRDPAAPAGPPTESVAFASVPDGVSTEAALVDHTWGTELMLDVEGLPGGQTYQVLYGDAEGQPSLAGSFRSVPDTLMRCRFNGAVLRTDLRRVSVVDPRNQVVLQADLA